MWWKVGAVRPLRGAAVGPGESSAASYRHRITVSRFFFFHSLILTFPFGFTTCESFQKSKKGQGVGVCLGGGVMGNVSAHLKRAQQV